MNYDFETANKRLITAGIALADAGERAREDFRKTTEAMQTVFKPSMLEELAKIAKNPFAKRPQQS